MPRRSWRDLDPPAAAPFGAPTPLATPLMPGDDLRQAAALAPDSRLGALLQQREALEQRLRGLSGIPSQTSDRDAFFAARFPVASFADRRAEQQRWEAQRQAGATGAAAPPDFGRAAAAAARPGLAETPLAQAMSAGLPDRATTGLGGAIGRLRNRFASNGSGAGALLNRARDAADQIETIARPLRDAGRQLDGFNRQLRDLDQRLDANGVSEADRAEVRQAVGGDTLDKTGKQMDRANSALSAPKALVDKVDNGWRDRQDRLTAPMDRRSAYTETRDRRLSTDTGGSGDLFERMTRNRQDALRRRLEAAAEEDRDRKRRDRAGEAARSRSADDRPPPERTAR